MTSGPDEKALETARAEAAGWGDRHLETDLDRRVVGDRGPAAERRGGRS